MTSFFSKIFRSKSSRAEMSTKVNLKELAAATADTSTDGDRAYLDNARSRADRMSVSRSGRFKARQRQRSALFENPIMIINGPSKDHVEESSKTKTSSSTSADVIGSRQTPLLDLPDNNNKDEQRDRLIVVDNGLLLTDEDNNPVRPAGTARATVGGNDNATFTSCRRQETAEADETSRQEL